MRNRLLFQLAKGIWAIEPSAAAKYMPLVQAILRGQSIEGLLPRADGYNQNASPEQMKMDMMRFASATSSFAHSTTNDISKAKPGCVAITPLTDVIMKQDNCGTPGTETLMSWMQEADQSDNVIAHILKTDSPGGSADAPYDFDQAVKSLNKPVVGFVSGMAASAAYGCISGCKHIMASNPICEIGSIGTYFSFDDYSKADEMQGIKNITVYATDSTEKNAEIREALQGNLAPLQARVDAFNASFLSSVKRNRYGKSLNTANTLKGQLMMTDAAIANGLCDSMGTLQDAINKAIQLSKN